MAKVGRGGWRKREIVNLRKNSAAGKHVNSAAGIPTLQGYGGIDGSQACADEEDALAGLART
jgi:hypothetical protein